MTPKDMTTGPIWWYFYLFAHHHSVSSYVNLNDQALKEQHNLLWSVHYQLDWKVELEQQCQGSMILGNAELSHGGLRMWHNSQKIKTWDFCSSNRLFETFIRRNVVDITGLLHPCVCNPRILISTMVEPSNVCPWAMRSSIIPLE
jgi:hypothetical protein